MLTEKLTECVCVCVSFLEWREDRETEEKGGRRNGKMRMEEQKKNERRKIVLKTIENINKQRNQEKY